MKKFRLGMIMAVFAFIAMLPLQASAAETKEVSVTCTPNESYTEYTVDLCIPNGAKEEISTLSLKLDVTPAGSATGYSSVIEFSEDVKARAKVYEYRAGNTLNIYVAGMNSLFNDDDTLRVGTVSMKNSAGESLALNGEKGVELDDAEDALLVVRGWGNAESPNQNTTWASDKEEEDPGPEIPPKPGDGEEDDKEGPDVPGGSDGSVVPGGSSDNTAKDQYDNNRKVSGSRTQGVKTGDTNTAIIYVFSVVACMGIIAAVAYRKRRAR